MMLSDWISCPIDDPSMSMSPRHWPEIRFKPATLNIRLDENDDVVIIKINGPRLIRGQADRTVLDHWEWDRDRDPAHELPEQILELLPTLITKGQR